MIFLLIHFPGAPKMAGFLSGEHHQVVPRAALWGIGLGMVVPVWSTGHVYAAWIPLENAVKMRLFEDV